MRSWIEPIKTAVQKELNKNTSIDDSHGYSHLCRVTELALQFAKEEEANELIVFAAGMFHDIVSLPKNHPDSSKSSILAAKRAEEILVELNFPLEHIPNICHSIKAHSFSANIPPETIEAKCVQDADRMEALGAFGLMRVFYCCGMFGTEILDEKDPGAVNRQVNDKKFALDHFEQKLFTLQKTMQTKSGTCIAASLTEFLKTYRQMLIKDHNDGNYDSPRFKIARVFKGSGKRREFLFHPEDPMGINGREHDHNKYALDGLLEEKDAYIRAFLKQLTFELDGYQNKASLGS